MQASPMCVPTLHEIMERDYLVNVWENELLHGRYPGENCIYHPIEFSERYIFGCAAFNVTASHPVLQLNDTAQRPIYGVLNLNNLAMGSPIFGGVSLILNRTAVEVGPPSSPCPAYSAESQVPSM